MTHGIFTYLKTVSLMAKIPRSAVVLGLQRKRSLQYAYGRNMGIAFQVSFFLSLLFSTRIDIFCKFSVLRVSSELVRLSQAYAEHGKEIGSAYGPRESRDINHVPRGVYSGMLRSKLNDA